MTRPPRLALIHATRVAIDPVEAVVRRHWPEAETISIMDEGLAVDRAKSAELTEDVTNRIVRLARYAEDIGADGILYTCSAFGAAIETAAATSPLPVMKPNEAMFEAAFAHGERVAMFYTFPPAAAGMQAEFDEEARRRGSKAVMTTVFCADAMDAKRAGDGERHDRLVAETAAGIAQADVILLAHFSTASAAPLVRQRTDIPVLTSPEAAIDAMRRRLSGGERQARS